MTSGPRFIKALTKSGILEMSPMPGAVGFNKTLSVSAGSKDKDDEGAEESSLADGQFTGKFGHLTVAKQDSFV